MEEKELKRLAMAQLMFTWSKKVLEAPKPTFRAGLKAPKNDWIDVTTSDYNTSKFSDEDQAKIDQFIADNGIKKLPLSTPDYKVNYSPKEQAKEEFKQMLNNLGINA